MPLTRNDAFDFGIGRRRRYRRMRHSKYSVKKLGPKQKKQVKTMISRTMDTRWFPVFFNQGSITSSGSITSLCQVTLGDDLANRDGSEIFPKHLHIKCEMIGTNGYVANEYYNFIRTIVFKWNEDDGISPPLVDSILDNQSGSVDSYLRSYNYRQRQKYTILYDKTVSLHPIYTFTSTGAPTNSKAQEIPKLITINLNLKGKINYTQTGVSPSTAGDGKIYMLQISNSGNAPHPLSKWTGYLKFKE